MGRYSIELVGESHYQDAVARLRVGDPVELVHEPDNRFDPMAVCASDLAGRTIGYIPRDSWLQRLVAEEGVDVLAKVRAIVGGGPGKPQLGVVLDIWTGAEAEAARDGRAAPDKPRPVQPAALGQIIEHRAPPRLVEQPHPETWVDRAYDSLFGGKPRKPYPGERPASWGSAGNPVIVNSGPNSFQSCMGCVGWGVVILIGLILLAQVLPNTQ